MVTKDESLKTTSNSYDQIKSQGAGMTLDNQSNSQSVKQSISQLV